MNDYQIFGLRFRSALFLPGFLDWNGDHRDPDITLTLDRVPFADPLEAFFSPAISIGTNGVRISIPDVATYWVEEGRSVVVETCLPVDEPAIRTFLYSTVLSVLCLQREELPLHASVVEIDGKGLVLAGESGVGKSTLAAAFVQRGYRMLSDDLCVLSLNGDSGAHILPAFPRLKLWQQSATHLGIDTADLPRIRDSIDKHFVNVGIENFYASPLKPALAVCMSMVEQQGVPVTFHKLTQAKAMMQFSMIHRWRLGIALGQRPRIFAAMAELVSQCPVFTLVRSRSLTTLDDTVDGLVSLMRDVEAA